MLFRPRAECDHTQRVTEKSFITELVALQRRSMKVLLLTTECKCKTFVQFFLEKCCVQLGGK